MKQQTLLCLKGHPGTGKSTLANSLSRHLRWPLIDKDDVKDHTWDLANGNELSYAVMWQIVETQLRNGLSVVVDSPLARPQLYEAAKSIALRHKVRLLVVQTTVDPAIWQQRLDSRRSSPSKHKPNNWADMEKQLAIYNGVFDYPIAPEDLLVVNTGQPIATLLAQIEQRLNGTRNS